MKKLGKLTMIAAAALVSSQAMAQSIFPDGAAGIGAFEPGSTRDPVTGVVTSPETTTETKQSKGNKGGKGKGRNK